MARLAISLLGCFQATLDGQPLRGLVSEKGRALLAYLVIEADRQHTRAALAALLWPHRPIDTARANLRQALHRLLDTLGDQSGSASFLLIDARALEFNRRSDHWLDVAVFAQAVESSRKHHPQGFGLCRSCLEHLEAAIFLYKGDLLTGFCLADCPEYEWWLLSRQEQYHHQALMALDRLALHAELIKEYDQSGRYAQRAIELEPWREASHRQKMRVLALGGHRCEALRQFETCRRILAAELGVDPALETVRLSRMIAEGSLVPSQDEAIHEGG